MSQALKFRPQCGEESLRLARKRPYRGSRLRLLDLSSFLIAALIQEPLP